MTSAVRVVLGDVTVFRESELPFPHRYTARYLGFTIRLRTSRGDVFGALVRECGLTLDQAARLLNQVDGGR
ncbi:hypothetical protein HNR23_003736 [Nocardiopsis mwathae]|uniref:Uncharacterized protein n=1 Tax=Nocardiopsis mwathae TaxID=1472723 RepID=A0A7X0D7F4_9ACTN|nr:hypothetical protein [Nocardiopsis mwathae]MBB6173676.1 hypothetical protein [Nocardiopsis mwathae]